MHAQQQLQQEYRHTHKKLTVNDTNTYSCPGHFSSFGDDIFRGLQMGVKNV